MSGPLGGGDFFDSHCRLYYAYSMISRGKARTLLCRHRHTHSPVSSPTSIGVINVSCRLLENVDTRPRGPYAAACRYSLLPSSDGCLQTIVSVDRCYGNAGALTLKPACRCTVIRTKQVASLT